MPFKKGQSGNPRGKQVGTRDKINQKFLKTLAEDFHANGEEVIAAAREKDPVGYMKVLAALLPKQVAVEADVKHEHTHIGLSEVASFLTEQIGSLSESHTQASSQDRPLLPAEVHTQAKGH